MATLNCALSYYCVVLKRIWGIEDPSPPWTDLYDAAVANELHEDWEPRAGYVFVSPAIEYNSLERSVLVFDTSSISLGTTIISAALKGYWVCTEFEHWLRFVDAPAAHVPSIASDYLYFRDCDTLLAELLHVYPPREPHLFSLPLNATGLAAINKGGSTIMALRTTYDTPVEPTLNTATFGILPGEDPIIPGELFYHVLLEVTYEPNPPAVTTIAATAIEETTGTENGEITDVGYENADERGFDWGPDVSYGNSWTELGDFGVGAFSHSVSGLSPGTTIHFRAKAHNIGGWGYGGDLTFVTKPEAPTDLTATAVSDSRINLSWTKGAGAVNTVIRGKIGSYPTDISDGYEVYNGPFEACSDQGLAASTTYYYRAWSYTDPHYSDAYSEDFATTMAGPPAITPPIVTTESANTIDQTISTINGVLTDDGGEACDCWFEYGRVGGTVHTTAIQSKTTGELFSQALSDLTPDTRYHFRAIARNSQGTTYGANMYFVTESPALLERSLMPLGIYY